MKHIKTPVCARHTSSVTGVEDADSVSICVQFQATHADRARMHEIATAINEHDDLIAQRDALADAADGLYDTVQDLRRIINGVLLDDESGPVLDDVMARGRKHILAYRAALASARGEQ